jgi:hypothetical protein
MSFTGEWTVRRNIRVCLCLIASGAVAAINTTAIYAQPSSNVSVYASGLNGPRGLKFGPDGMLYVAEAGTGGSISTVGKCDQVPPPVGPYLGGNTARISKVDRFGNVSTVVSGLPSTLSPIGDMDGVGDVAFLNGSLYAVLAGGGCSHGNFGAPNALIKVDTKAKTWKQVADLSKFLMSHPAKYPNPGDFEPDGVFYSLIASGGSLYTVEPNHGQVFSITPRGAVAEEVDISKAENHIVPTAIAENYGTFYVGNLHTFPIVPETSKVLTLSKEGCRWPFLLGFGCWDPQSGLRVSGSRAGFTTVVGLAFGPDGLLYALELSAAPGFPTPGEGKVVRLNRQGEIEDVATGLVVPTGMTFGPDGRLYVSNFGAAPPGTGQIVRITIP